MQLLERIAASMTIRFGGATEPDELRSFALVGLANAIDKYDESRGVPFSAYASQRIRGAVYDGLAVAGGRLFMTLRDGTVLCMGGRDR